MEQVAGRIWGVLNIRYADGREVPRRLSGERAFRARVRFPSHTEETLYMLQACGNDLRYGGISRYLPGPEFRFEADMPATPAPAPVPQPATTASATTPAPAPIAVPEALVETVAITDDGTVTFEFKKATNGQPSMVRIKGIETEEFTFSAGPDGTTLRYKEVAKVS